MSAGTHRLRLEAERFLPREQALEIEGMEIEQSLALDLAPGWGTYRVETQPAGASILLDGTQLGVTPTEVELMAGRRTLALQLAGFADAALSIEASAGERQQLPPVALRRADARVQLSSRPSGASVTVDGVFQGSTPLELALDSSATHELIAFKAGYERAVRKLGPGTGAGQQLVLELRPITGEVRLDVKPADAQIFSGERLLGKGSQTLRLPSTAQKLTIRRSGFASETLQRDATPGLPPDVQREPAHRRTAKTRRSEIPHHHWHRPGAGVAAPCRLLDGLLATRGGAARERGPARGADAASVLSWRRGSQQRENSACIAAPTHRAISRARA